jgi:hypothetical protein
MAGAEAAGKPRLTPRLLAELLVIERAEFKLGLQSRPPRRRADQCAWILRRRHDPELRRGGAGRPTTGQARDGNSADDHAWIFPTRVRSDS